MDEHLLKILRSKQVMRSEMGDLPFAEKIVVLEKLRDRELAIMNSRQPSSSVSENEVRSDGADIRTY